MLYLRWSLTIISISSFAGTSLAVPIPGPNDPKAPSREYRAEAGQAPYGFELSPGGTTVDRFHEQGPRPPRPFEDADHLLEAQTLHRALNDQGNPYHTLPAVHQAGIREILNDRTNMAFIDRGLNRGKGQVVRHGQEGHQLNPNPGRDAYTRATVPNAVHTADRLDEYLVHHGYHGNVRDTHTTAMRAAGILQHGESTPINTPAPAGPSHISQHFQSLNIGGSHTPGHSSHGSHGSSPVGSAPHSPTPFHPVHGPHVPETPRHQGTHDPTLGSHAPHRPAAHDLFAPLPPIPQHFNSPTHHPVTPPRQIEHHEDHADLGHYAPHRPLVRSNTFGGRASPPLAAHDHDMHGHHEHDHSSHASSSPPPSPHDHTMHHGRQ